MALYEKRTSSPSCSRQEGTHYENTFLFHLLTALLLQLYSKTPKRDRHHKGSLDTLHFSASTEVVNHLSNHPVAFFLKGVWGNILDRTRKLFSLTRFSNNRSITLMSITRSCCGFISGTILKDRCQIKEMEMIFPQKIPLCKAVKHFSEKSETLKMHLFTMAETIILDIF